MLFRSEVLRNCILSSGYNQAGERVFIIGSSSGHRALTHKISFIRQYGIKLVKSIVGALSLHHSVEGNYVQGNKAYSSNVTRVS